MDQSAWERRSELTHLKERYGLLTPREQEVLPFVVAGFLNKPDSGEFLRRLPWNLGLKRGIIDL